MKRFLSILLVICMMAGFAIPAAATEEAADNQCGAYAYWAFDEATGILTISGSGTMYDSYTSSAHMPWADWREQIKTVVVEDGISAISDHAFSGCTSLTHVVLADSVKLIGQRAFYNCTELYTAGIGSGVTTLEDQAFYGCESLVGLYLGSGIIEISSNALVGTNTNLVVYYDGTEDEWYDVDDNAALEDVVFLQEDVDLTGISDSAIWSYDPHSFAVVISGGGKTKDYAGTTSDRVPWYDFIKVVRTVVVEDGVLGIGEKTFRDHQYLNTVYLPQSVTEIDNDAFASCKKLETVFYDGTVEQFYDIEIGTGNTYLTNANIYCAGGCSHASVSGSYASNGDETHSITYTCALCGEQTKVETEACTDSDANGACDKCQGGVVSGGSGSEPETCQHTNLTGEQYAQSTGGKTHSHTATCADCGEALDFGFETCVDANTDSVCDLCGGTIGGSSSDEEEEPACTHENTTQSIVSNSNKTHTITDTCTAEGCGQVVNTTVLPCADGDSDDKCDVCGAQVLYIKWKYSASDGVLTISGNGPMDDYERASLVPWYSVRANIKEVVIEEGVTHIGTYSFYSCTSLTKVTIPVSVTSIGDYAFRACSALTDVTYGGSDRQWAAVTVGVYNTDLTDVLKAAVCDHADCKQTITANADKTHTVNAVCNTCNTELEPVTTACTAGDTVCTAGNGTHINTVRCTVCDQVLVAETVPCTDTTTTTVNNNDRTHTVTIKCNTCGGTVSNITSACTDGEDEGKLCDTCGFDLTCSHPSYVKAYNSNGDFATHTYAYNCQVCGEEVDALYDEACSGANGETCDLCGQDYSCQHNEEDLRTETKYYHTTRSDVYTHEQRTVVYCDGEDCDLPGRIYSSTFVEERNCADTTGDDLCDLCGRNMLCGHENTTTTNTHNGYNTHQLVVTCNICGDKVQNMEVACTYSEPGTACLICKEACEHELSYSYTARTDAEEQHYIAYTCDYCDYEVSGIPADCRDTVHDNVCDDCGSAVSCKHEQKITYYANEDGTHNQFRSCDTCEDVDATCDTCHLFFGETLYIPCADGEDADYLCDDCGADFAEAAVGTVAYATFAAAMEVAEDGDTVTVLKNTTVNEGVVVEGMDLTLKGNDVTLTFDIPGADSLAACDGQLTLGEGLTVKSDKALLWAYNGGEIVVDGADLETTTTDYIAAFADEDGIITVKSGSIRSIDNTVQAIAGGKVVIEGGTVECIADETAFLCTVWAYGGEIVISGGTVLGGNTSAVLSSTGGTVTITGGTVKNTLTGGVFYRTNGTYVVSGGVFSAPVAEAYCAEGYKPCDNGDGTYGVKVAVTNVNVAGSNMTLGNDLKINFMIRTADMGDETYTIRVSQPGKEAATLTPARYNAIYQYVSYSVAAKEMADVLTVEVLDAEGNVVSEPYTRTVAAYAVTLLNAETSTDALKKLVVDMLNYGTEAQKYFAYNETSYANAVLTAEQQEAYATKEVSCEDTRVKGTNFQGSNLSLESSILMNAFFKGATAADLSKLSATVTYVDYKGREVTAEADVAMYGSWVKVTVDRIVLADARCMVTINLYKDGSLIGSGAESVGSYVARSMSDASTGALNVAILKFADSAYAHLGGTYHD